MFQDILNFIYKRLSGKTREKHDHMRELERQSNALYILQMISVNYTLSSTLHVLDLFSLVQEIMHCAGLEEQTPCKATCCVCT